MLMYMVIFFLGMMAGAVGVMVISCLMVDSMNKKKRELTKEEWKMGIHPDQYPYHKIPKNSYLVHSILRTSPVKALIQNRFLPRNSQC